MATITPISILNRIGAPGAPSFLSPGELAYNQPETTAPVEPLDALYIGNGTSVSVLVGRARQLELWGAQTIVPGSPKTINVEDLKVIGGEPEWVLQTDGNGNLSFTSAPGGGISQVATDVTLTGQGTPASPLSVVAHAVAVAADGVTISGNGTTQFPLAVIGHTVSVAVDGTTINGDGTAANPLHVDPDTIPVVTNATLTGNGTTASPLGVVANSVPVATNATLAGNGTTGSPLGVVADTVPVATDGITITGNGTTGSPLTAMNGTVAVAVDGTTIAGEGVTASPLRVLPNSVPVATNATLIGNGTTATPLGLATPVSLQNGGTGVSASSSATLLTALGAASVASLSNYLPLSGASAMQGGLTLAGNATSNLQAVPLQQLNSAVAAVPGNAYGTTAPASPVAGTFWFNPTTQVGQMWSGSAWVTVVPAPVVTQVTLQGDTTGSAP